jgi:hypothetical protein
MMFYRILKTRSIATHSPVPIMVPCQAAENYPECLLSQLFPCWYNVYSSSHTPCHAVCFPSSAAATTKAYMGSSSYVLRSISNTYPSHLSSSHGASLLFSGQLHRTVPARYPKEHLARKWLCGHILSHQCSDDC